MRILLGLAFVTLILVAALGFALDDRFWSVGAFIGLAVLTVPGLVMAAQLNRAGSVVYCIFMICAWSAAAYATWVYSIPS